MAVGRRPTATPDPQVRSVIQTPETLRKSRFHRKCLQIQTVFQTPQLAPSDCQWSHGRPDGNAIWVGPMTKRLSRSGNSLALVIDRPLLEALEIDADTELELSTDGDVLVVTPVRDRKRSKRVDELVSEAHEQYGGVFRRLAE